MKFLRIAAAYFLLAWIGSIIAYFVVSVSAHLLDSKFMKLLSVPGRTVDLFSFCLRTQSLLLAAGAASLISTIAASSNGYRQSGLPLLPPIIAAGVFFFYQQSGMDEDVLSHLGQHLPYFAALAFAFAGWAVNLFMCRDNILQQPTTPSEFQPSSTRWT